MHTQPNPTPSLRLLLLYLNHYDTLSLRKDASQKEIRARYYELAKKSHPDSGKGSSQQFVKIHEAYYVLSDEQRRKAYDNGSEGGFTIHSQSTFRSHSYQYYRSSHPEENYAKWAHTPETEPQNIYLIILTTMAFFGFIYFLMRSTPDIQLYRSPLGSQKRRKTDISMYRREIEEKQIHGSIVDVKIPSERPSKGSKEGMGAANFIMLRDIGMISE